MQHQWYDDFHKIGITLLTTWNLGYFSTSFICGKGVCERTHLSLHPKMASAATAGPSSTGDNQNTVGIFTHSLQNSIAVLWSLHNSNYVLGLLYQSPPDWYSTWNHYLPRWNGRIQNIAWKSAKANKGKNSVQWTPFCLR